MHVSVCICGSQSSWPLDMDVLARTTVCVHLSYLLQIPSFHLFSDLQGTGQTPSLKYSPPQRSHTHIKAAISLPQMRTFMYRPNDPRSHYHTHIRVGSHLTWLIPGSPPPWLAIFPSLILPLLLFFCLCLDSNQSLCDIWNVLWF